MNKQISMVFNKEDIEDDIDYVKNAFKDYEPYEIIYKKVLYIENQIEIIIERL